MNPFSNSSKLSEKVNVLKKDAQNTNEWGKPSYTLLGVCWCSVKDKIGNETLISEQNKRVSTAKTTFTMRLSSFTDSITPDMKFEWRGHRFNILSGGVYSADRNFITFEAERQY